MLHSTASDLGLHNLLRPVCPLNLVLNNNCHISRAIFTKLAKIRITLIYCTNIQNYNLGHKAKYFISLKSSFEDIFAELFQTSNDSIQDNTVKAQVLGQTGLMKLCRPRSDAAKSSI